MLGPRCPSPIAAVGPGLGLGSLGMFGAQGILTAVELHTCRFGFSTGDTLTWRGRKAQPGRGHPLSHRVTLCPQGPAG